MNFSSHLKLDQQIISYSENNADGETSGRLYQDHQKVKFSLKKRKFVRTRHKSTGNFPSQERALAKSLDETNKTFVLD
jgi:hypothetical protein